MPTFFRKPVDLAFDKYLEQNSIDSFELYLSIMEASG